MDKATVRSKVRAQRCDLRESMTDVGWASRSAAIADAAIAIPAIREACRASATIAAYSSYGTEPPTDSLIELLTARGARVVLPVIRTPDDPLLWADSANPLEPDERGIPTPAGEILANNAAELLALNCQVIMVPALAVAPNGTRLGRGGGYYDRLLHHIPRHESTANGPMRITIVSAAEVFADLPRDEYDQDVDQWIIG